MPPVGPRGAAVLAPEEVDASLEATLPPTPLRDLLAADGAAVYVCSADAALTQVAQEAAGEHFPVLPVEDWPALLRALRSGGRIVLLDADAAPGGIEKGLRELERLPVAPIVLVAATRGASQRLMGLLSEGKIHRLLIKPAAAGITRLLLESAVTRYLQLRDVGGWRALPVEIEDEPFEAPRMRRRRSKALGLGGWPTWTAAGIVVAAAVAAALLASGVGGPESAVGRWLGRSAVQGRAPAPPESAGVAAQASSASRASADAPAPARLPAVAPPVTHAPREAPPARPVSAETPPPVAAAASALPGTAPEAESATAPPRDSARAPEAARAPNPVPEAAPASNPAPASIPAPAPPAAAASQGPSDLTTDLALARARLAAGQLLAPADDSAEGYYRAAAAARPDDPSVLKLRLDLAAALVGAVRVALDGDDIDRASKLADEAFRLGADQETLAELQADLRAAQAQRVQQARAAMLATANERLAAGRVVAPADDSALHYLGALQQQDPAFPGLPAAWAAARTAVTSGVKAALEKGDWMTAQAWTSALAKVDPDPKAVRALQHATRVVRYLAVPAAPGELRLVESAPLEYPPVARRRGIDGWVELRFVVGLDGRPRDVQVVEASPKGIFDKAALAAVSRQRYAPYVEDGVTYERLANLRVQFRLE